MVRLRSPQVRSGQALIVVLLILGVVTTVGLSIASRSVTEVGVSTTSEESSRALSAAEAGIEAQLAGAQIPTISGTNITVDEKPSGSAGSLSVADLVASGEVATVFVDTSTGNSMTVCWGEAKLETAVYYKVGINTKIDRKYIASGNLGTCPADGRTYINSTSITLPNGAEYVRMRLWGNGEVKQPLGVTTSGTFPAQGTEITSTGTVGSTVRKIKVFDQTPDVPEVFEAAIFSGKRLVK